MHCYNVLMRSMRSSFGLPVLEHLTLTCAEQGVGSFYSYLSSCSFIAYSCSTFLPCIFVFSINGFYIIYRVGNSDS